MEPRNFLQRLQKKKTLVITAGDRNDILMTIACAQSCPDYRKVAGVILSGGIDPDPGVLKLIEDMKLPPLPIMKVESDSFKTAVSVQKVDVRLRPKDQEKISTASSRVADAIDAEALWKALNIPLPKRKRSSSELFLEQLIEQARSFGNHIVMPEGSEPRTLKAAKKIEELGMCDLTLLGDVDRIHQVAKSLGVSFNNRVKILDPRESSRLEEYANVAVEARKGKRGGVTKDVALEWLQESTVNFGTVMVKQGHADGLVSGAVHSTADTIRPALQIIRIKQGTEVASSVFFMALKDRVLVYGDCAIVPNPNAHELASIALSSARTARAFGIEPRVALLSYSTGLSGKGEAVDKVTQALEYVRETNPDFAIDGPLQYDAAIDPEVGHLKLPDSPVAGSANVFIFPDLNAGNIAYKAVQRSAGALAVGPVLQGLNKPVNDLSRGCSVDDIVYTVAVTAIQAAKDAHIAEPSYEI
jgi:phosphate acetyltransferase